VIIAELCQNHRGNLTVLREMVGEAARAGAKFAKIQTFFADDLARRWRDRYNHYKELELSWSDHEKFVGYCLSEGITPMTSVYNPRYLSQLNEIGFRHIKVGSADAQNEHLIRFINVNGMKSYVSTGGQDLSGIPKGLKGIECYFHCVSKYPGNYKEANLSRFIRMKEYFPNTKIGFSDHTFPEDPNALLPSMVASALGAAYIEKHFTICCRSLTKDGGVSINFKQLKKLCEFHERTTDFKLTMLPEIPVDLFRDNMDQEEKEIIQKYQGRWKI